MPDLAWDASADTPTELYEHYPPGVAGAVIRRLRQLARGEPAVTRTVLAALPANARAAGLEFRMKSPSSMARKVADRLELNRETDPEESASKLTDVLRYTAVAETADEVMPMAKTTLANLHRQGWTTVEAEHSYYPGSTYKGVHVLIRPSGSDQVLEVQFHSERSMSVKTQIHADYEIERDVYAPSEDRQAAHDRMVEQSAAVKTPSGITEPELGGVRFTIKGPPPVENHT